MYTQKSDFFDRASKMKISSIQTQGRPCTRLRDQVMEGTPHKKGKEGHKYSRNTYGITKKLTMTMLTHHGKAGETVGLPIAAMAPGGSFDSRMQRPLQ